MSRREYPVADRYAERESDFYQRPRQDRRYDDLEVDITRSHYPESRRGAETIVRERDTSISERPRRQPDFLREDYGKSDAGQLVIRRSDDDTQSRRSRAPRERDEEIIIRERERDRGLPYPRSSRSEVEFREADRESAISRNTRSRPPPSESRSKDEEIDITIRRGEGERAPPPPRSEVREREVEDIRFRRGGPGGVRLVEEEIDIRESRSPAPARPRSILTNKNELEIDIREENRTGRRGREIHEDEIRIRERSVSRPAPRQRSMSRGALVARKEEEWVVRRPRTPPKKEFEQQEIIIRRKERTPSPEPVREPTPEPSPPPPLEPIYRPPIIQEFITHHRHIDHGVERARSPTPPPPPREPSPPRVEDLEIEIKRKGVRNGRNFEEDIIIDREYINRGRRPSPSPSPPPPPVRERERERSRIDIDIHERDRRGGERDLEIDIKRSESRAPAAPPARSMSRGPIARRGPEPRFAEDEIGAEADYYNRKIAARAYPGEAYNGATRDWSLVDVPPGTEKVRMDGVGGGSQEITWQRYNGERRGRFVTDRGVYEGEYAQNYTPPAPLAPPPAPAPPAPEKPREFKEEIIIKETHSESRPPPAAAPPPRRKRDKMWTEVTKDLVIREAIDEMGYEYEETEEHFYVIEYLKYEDVLRLVEISEDIRRERTQRIREIQWERERAERAAALPPLKALPPPERHRGDYEEKIYEREYIYDRDGRGRRYR